MECESGDLLCGGLRFLDQLWLDWPIWLHWAIVLIGKYNGALIGMAGLAFGILQWYWSWESKMFEHLDRLLDKDIHELWEAERRILTIVRQPGPAITVLASKFSEIQLQKLLRHNIWRSVLSAKGTTADKGLDQAIERLKKLHSWTDRRQSFFRSQLAAAHLIKGAIAAERARNIGYSDAERRDLSENAIEEFEAVRSSSSDEIQRLAIECAAEEYLRLGLLEKAHSGFERLETLSPAGTASAIIAQWKQARVMLEKRLNGLPNGGMNAASKIIQTAISALRQPAAADLRGNFQLALMHDDHCHIRMEMANARKVMAESYDSASKYYKNVLDGIRSRRKTTLGKMLFWLSDWWNGARIGELRRDAEKRRDALISRYNNYRAPLVNDPPTSSDGVETVAPNLTREGATEPPAFMLPPPTE